MNKNEKIVSIVLSLLAIAAIIATIVVIVQSNIKELFKRLLFLVLDGAENYFLVI